MPVDARSLLRAAAASSSSQSASDGIKDRYASYHPKTRALRCLACNYLAIKHESLWASHAASKSHRTNVQQIRKQEEEEEEKKRLLRNEQEGQENDLEVQGGKRKTSDSQAEMEDDKETTKRARKESGEVEGDSEWERFQREVLDAPTASIEQPSFSSYADATVEVAPELRAKGDQMDEEQDEETEEVEVKHQETDVQRRARLELEEREEILSRFEEEQRVQDEAEERVNALKNRWERLKQARSTKKR